MSQIIPIYIPTLISDINYNPAKVYPRLFFYNGIVECEPYWFQYKAASGSATITNTQISAFPYVDHYSVVSGSFPTANSKTLLYQNETPVYGAVPTSSLYSDYWETYINLLYDPKTRLFNCSGIIPLADYFKMELNDIVEWRGNYYHLRAINDYNLTTGDCNLQLLGPIIKDTFAVEYDCDFSFNATNIPTTTTTTTSAPTTTTTTTAAPAGPFVATGGITGSFTSGSVTYKYHQFSSLGSASLQVLSGATTSSQVLVIGGGGGGGYSQNTTIITPSAAAAGGGGGGVYFTQVNLSSGSYDLFVGSGSVKTENGQDSWIDTKYQVTSSNAQYPVGNRLTAFGGGRGSYSVYYFGSANAGYVAAGNGGSGGGGGRYFVQGAGGSGTRRVTAPAGSGTAGQGNNGGSETYSGNYLVACGGGGAGTEGVDWTTFGDAATAGGDGLAYNVNGTLTYYGAGGGAIELTTVANGGNGSGNYGAGGSGSHDNTGGGLSTAKTSGKQGAIFIIYPEPPTTTTTTTTISPTTTTTSTTTTTTAAPANYYYLIRRYTCPGCTIGSTSIGISSTALTVGNFYGYPGDTECYEIVSTTTSTGWSVDLNYMTGFTSCALYCSV